MAAITSGSSLSKGESLFKVFCANCHGEKGKGATPTKVAQAQVVSNMDDVTIGSTIKNGLAGTRMPGFAKTLSEQQIADVITFIRSWGK